MPEKSMARNKYLITMFIAWGCAASLVLVEHNYLRIGLIIMFVICSIGLMLISCERCGRPVYLGESKIPGFPDLRIFPDKKCPGCGICR
jgi:hypothetical protein